MDIDVRIQEFLDTYFIRKIKMLGRGEKVRDYKSGQNFDQCIGFSFRYELTSQRCKVRRSYANDSRQSVNRELHQSRAWFCRQHHRQVFVVAKFCCRCNNATHEQIFKWCRVLCARQKRLKNSSSDRTCSASSKISFPPGNIRYKVARETSANSQTSLTVNRDTPHLSIAIFVASKTRDSISLIRETGREIECEVIVRQ